MWVGSSDRLHGNCCYCQLLTTAGMNSCIVWRIKYSKYFPALTSQTSCFTFFSCTINLFMYFVIPVWTSLSNEVLQTTLYNLAGSLSKCSRASLCTVVRRVLVTGYYIVLSVTVRTSALPVLSPRGAQCIDGKTGFSVTDAAAVELWEHWTKQAPMSVNYLLIVQDTARHKMTRTTRHLLSQRVGFVRARETKN